MTIARVFDGRTDEQTYTSILATIDDNRKSVTFKYDGTTYKRKLRIHKSGYAGFHFRGWFFDTTNMEGLR